uniref:exodeoxyribonuclease VII large subunit n=1 Tax=uncultured Stenotrophomonas sp. TaxID=165438 RepID=UPI0028D3C638
QRALPRVDAAMARQLQRDTLRLRALARSMEAVSPLATVARGYAILTREEDGRLVRSPLDVAPGDALKARVQDGVIDVVVSKP